MRIPIRGFGCPAWIAEGAKGKRKGKRTNAALLPQYVEWNEFPGKREFRRPLQGALRCGERTHGTSESGLRLRV